MPNQPAQFPAAKKTKDLRLALQQFYQQPVARVSFELFLTVVAVLFFAIFAIRPTLLTMSDLIKEIDDKQNLDQQLSKKIAALSTIQSEYLQLEDRLEVIDEALPSSPEILYSLQVIEKTASDIELVISEISVNEIPTTTRALDDNSVTSSAQRINLPMSISVAGAYPHIRQFVENLQNYRRSFVIDSVIFTTEEVKSSKELRAKITLTTPYFGPPELAATEEAPSWTSFKKPSSKSGNNSNCSLFSSSP